MKPRRAARCLALEILYEHDVAEHPIDAIFGRRLQVDIVDDSPLSYMEPESVEFTRVLLNGVQKYRAYGDNLISQYAPEWPLDQIAIIDRNILRLACYEILVMRHTPVKVAINEAVELAKLYGSESSPRFVNGVLGTLTDHLKTLRAEVAKLEETVSA